MLHGRRLSDKPGMANLPKRNWVDYFIFVFGAVLEQHDHFNKSYRIITFRAHSKWSRTSNSIIWFENIIFDEHSYIDWHIFWQFCQWDMIGKILIIALFCKVSWSLPKSRPRVRWNRIHWEIPRQLDLKSGCVCIYVERYLPDLINRLIDFSELIFCSWTDDYIIKLASERRTRTNLTGKPNEFSLNWMFLCGHNSLRSQSLDNKAGHPFWHKLKIIVKSNSW